jgi:hypothetical protein
MKVKTNSVTNSVSFRKARNQDNEISIKYSTYNNPEKTMSINHTATIFINYKTEEMERHLNRRCLYANHLE